MERGCKHCVVDFAGRHRWTVLVRQSRWRVKTGERAWRQDHCFKGQQCVFPQKPGAELGGPNWAFPSGCTTQTFYNWDPTSAMGVSESGMLGVEGAIWSEHLRTEHDMQFVTLPRLYALAEVGWTPQSQRNYADFASRLP
ncbi:family 20 glycosylhydrolase [Bifidobacterium tsurumiense]|uniref:family 20 glycosylhydrolase n=1 Tax=Bifidobacterium tsurumiense TaxID=356829 RepID=UPI0009DB7A13|nr:family 20 glycosylhydrolase [Bifidobacterium tsurumiense]